MIKIITPIKNNPTTKAGLLKINEEKEEVINEKLEIKKLRN